MREISPIDFFKVYQKTPSLRIIDVRDTFEFEKYHLNDSLNIPLALLYEKHYLFLNKKHVYYVICKNGSQSKLATRFLESNGYHAINVIGGLDHWMGSYNLNSFYY